MLTAYLILLGFLNRRADRDERGDVLAFLAIGAMVIAVVVVMIPQVHSLVKDVLDGIRSKIGGLS